MKTLCIVTVCCLGLLANDSMLRAEQAAAAPEAVSIEVAAVETTPTPFVVTEPAEAPAPVATEQTVPQESQIEIGYIEADIQNVLRTLAAKAGINLILGEEVTGKVTVNLKGVSYEDAMRLIVESKGYAYVKDKNVVKVKSRESLEAEPVEIQVHTLNYAKADDVKKSLEPVLTKQGKLQVDTRSNTLVISDTPSNLSRLMPLIQSLDTQTPQVMIEAKFVETTKNPKKDLGINWTETLLNHELSAGPFDLTKNLGGGPWIPSTALLDAGEAKLLFSFLSRDTDTELLANPRIVTTDNGKAKISIATQFPIPQFAFSEQVGAFTVQGFDYKDIGIVLNVTPRINKNEFITLEVTPEASSSTESASFQGIEIPIINTRVASTVVLIKSGHTLAIGGLMRQDVSDSYTKVPLLGDVPLLGALFRSKSLSKTKRDLLIFLTPTIVGPEAQTGYERFYGGLPKEEVYTNDKWMPGDNAKPRELMKRRAGAADAGRTKTVSQNFSHK